MSAELLKGKPVADAIADEIRSSIARLASLPVPITPGLATVRLGSRSDDIAYERNIIKRAESLGLRAKNLSLPETASQDELLSAISDLARDDSVHGILPFRPMPPHIKGGALKQAIPPEKDIDCIGAPSSASVYDRSLPGFLPCTAEAVIELLRFRKIPLEGANVVVLGRSMVVGRALALLLLDENCTVTVCHSKTRGIEAISSKADILICAMGRARKVTAPYIKTGAAVIDVGINDDGNGGICGDADYESVSQIAGTITPVPGGIGTITNTILIRHAVNACIAAKRKD
ncbi:bifunctional protein FolD [Synergistales bacterium]|nr:bifunctional protein FolD [Synergistales bacterium]GHV50687.1 bifunctional protein FolD [Synergistales bacterium]